MGPDRITSDVARAAVDDPNLLWEYVLSLSQADPESGTEEGLARFLASLPRGLQVVYWVVVFDGEILNGGIRQVFWNHDAWEVGEMLKALDEIGAVDSATQLRRAIDVFETTETPTTREAYWFEDKEFHAEPTLNAIDDLRCTDAASMRDWKLLGQYIGKHPELCLHG